MNTTRRYFELKNQIVEAINRAELPPVMADAALREVRGQVLQAMERELREEENEATEQNGQPFPSSGALRHLPPEGKAGAAEAANNIQRPADLPENMDVEDDGIPSNMDVIDEDGDGMPDNMELETDERQVGNNEPSPHQSASRTASPAGEA